MFGQCRRLCWKIKSCTGNSFTVPFSKLKMLYMFKTFVSLLSGHASYLFSVPYVPHGTEKYPWRSSSLFTLLHRPVTRSLWSKYSPQNPTLKHSADVSSCTRPCSTTAYNNRQNYGFTCFNFYISGQRRIWQKIWTQWLQNFLRSISS